MPTPSRGPGRPRSPIDTTTPAGKIAQRIRRAREKAGLTVEEAAAKAGLAKSTWWYYESAERTPSLAQLSAVAEALGTEARKLI